MHPTESTAARRFHRDGTLPAPGTIFVFGSNEAGRHGAGAALAARNDFGAVYGVGKGRTGNAYAIPTKNRSQNLRLPSANLSLEVVRGHVNDFIQYAAAHPELTFFVSRIGCGLAQFRDSEVAPLFALAPSNCTFAAEWRQHLQPDSPRATPTPARSPRP